MNREKELAKNTIILFIGIFFTKIIQYFMLPFYTTFLTTAEYGTVELLNTIITLLLPIIGLQVDQGVFRFLIGSRNKKSETNKLISSAFYFVILSSLIYILLFLIISPFINNEYKWLLVINLFFTNLSSLFMQISRGIGSNSDYSISGIMTAVFTILFNILFIIGIHLKVDGILIGGSIGYFIGIIYLFIKLRLYKSISIKYFDKTVIKQVLLYSLPMIPNAISWWIFSSSDRIIISSFVGLDANGILSVAYKFSSIAIIIYNIFNMSLTESISLHIKDNDIEEYYNKIFNVTGNIFVSFSSILIAFMPIMFNILINKSFSDAYNLIPIAILASEFQVFVGLLSTLYISNKKTKEVATTSIIAAIINITLDIILVKYIGIYAAIVSTLASYLFLCLYRYYDVNKKYLKVRFSKALINDIFCNIVIILIYYINYNFAIVVNIVLAIVFAYIFNKNGIHVLFEIIKNRLPKKEVNHDKK